MLRAFIIATMYQVIGQIVQLHRIWGLALMSGEQEPGGAAVRLTIDQLSLRVGMSARNIRAYQARRLLTPPVRSGRTAYYGEGHVHRLEAIHELQRQGYNLVAIATILGVHEQAPRHDEMTALLERLLAQQPLLMHALCRHGIVSRSDDGGVRMVRPRVLRAALALSQAGIQPGPSLHLLSEALDHVMLMAEELVRAVSAQALSAAPRTGTRPPRAPGSQSSPGDPADDTAPHSATPLPPAPLSVTPLSAMPLSAGLTERLVTLLTEAFRVAVENNGHAWLPGLAAPRSGATPRPRATQVMDFG